MPTFALKLLNIEGAHVPFYSLIRNGKDMFSDFIEDSKLKLNISKEDSLNLKVDKLDEVQELLVLIEDIALNNPVIGNAKTLLKEKKLIYNTLEIKTNKMLRVYCMKLQDPHGRAIVIGHIKQNKKEQDRVIKKVVSIQKEYRSYLALLKRQRKSIRIIT